MKKLVTYLLFILIFATSLWSSPSIYASCDNPTTEMEKVNCILNEIKPDNAPDPLDIESRSQANTETEDSFAEQFKNIVGIATGVLASFAGIFAVIMLLSHSVKLITSQGDKGKIDEAKNGIIYSLLGIVGIVLSYSIVYTIIDVIYKQLGN